jgi:putative transposase
LRLERLQGARSHGIQRRLIHCNVTAHPSAAWTLQQLREALGYEDQYEFLIHDRDSIFAHYLDESIGRLRVRVLKSPPHSPKANSICERVLGTIRRECPDWLIPLSEAHLRFTLKSWIAHYNGARPHMALGPGIPHPPVSTLVLIRAIAAKNRMPSGANPILGGLHHEYSLVAACA